jgi:DNA replicative helicase MCM subunit Mcm2 (Cdc46/Mcm family)
MHPWHDLMLMPLIIFLGDISLYRYDCILRGYLWQIFINQKGHYWRMDIKSLIEYQNMLQQKIRQEQKVDRKIDLLSIINQLTSGPNERVQKEQLLIEAVAQGFSEREIEEHLKKLISEGIITENTGFLRKR